MPSNLALRLTTASHVFVTKNRKVSHPWRWGKLVVGALVLAATGVLFTSMFLSWVDLQDLTQSYQISQAQETQKQYLDLNQKLRLELTSLTAISRLENLASDYGMAPPAPSQIVKLP